MIAFCCVTSDHEVFGLRAAAAMRAVVEADSLLMRRHAPDSLAAAFNEMLALAGEQPDLEAVVLFAEDTVLEGQDLPARVRSSLTGDAAVLGAVPAREMPGLLAAREPQPAGVLEGVDAVDGSLVVLSPWATGALRFDPELDPSLDGCAVDLCLQARAGGRAVLAGGLGVVRRPQSGDGARSEQVEVALRRKWHQA